MTIQEAIQTAIDQLDGVRLPVRDGANANRIREAIGLLEAMRESLNRKPEEETGGEPDVEDH